MRPVSRGWLAALAQHQRPVAYVTLLGEEGETEVPGLTGGSVTLDATSAVRGRMDLTFVDDGLLGLVPTEPTDTLTPYGNELRVYRGLRYSDGSVELVSLGIFRIEDVDVQEQSGGVEISVAGQDRAAAVTEEVFEEPMQVPAGTLFTDAIREGLEEILPDVETNFVTSSVTTPLLGAEEGEDRWAFYQGMATALGGELYFDGDGVCVLRPIPEPSGTAVAILAEGENGVLVSAGRTWTRQDSFNKVIATGEGATLDEAEAPRGVAFDDNPSSPTYYYGRFGRVTRFYASEYLTTQDQAQDAAQGILNRELGTSRQVSFGTIVNPALEPGDVVRITRTSLGVDEDHVIDSLTIPLGHAETMDGTTRSKTVTT